MLKCVNWFKEGLDTYYGHRNDGLMYGIYYYETWNEDFPIEVEWFASEEERDQAIIEEINHA